MIVLEIAVVIALVIALVVVVEVVAASIAMVSQGEELWISFSSLSISGVLALCAVVLVGLEVLSRVVPILFSSANRIQVRGKHLDTLDFYDQLYISINKLLTCMFVYHLLYIACNTSSIEWDNNKINIYNSIGSLVLFYLFYDFFYMSFHRLLHVRSLYGYIHKHHHRQKAPSRGNLDAINVHPFEFLVGEYLHLLTIYCIPCHIYTVVFFILAGGILASLNHTRLDINLFTIYSVKVHDVHHRLPESNYGQYTMVWDKVFGSYRDYNENLKADGEESKKSS